AEHHRSAHVVLRALGLTEDVEIEVQGPLPLRSGDTLVLTTDGLTRLVRPHEIRRLAKIRPLRRACEQLVSMANERGGPDNITLQLIRFGSRRVLPPLPSSPRAWEAARRASGSLRPGLADPPQPLPSGPRRPCPLVT